MIIDLDTALKPAVLKPATIEALATKLAARSNKDRLMAENPEIRAYYEKQGTKMAPSDTLIDHDISDLNAHHSNYMEYLRQCWSSHYGVVVTPDIIWYTVLSEIAEIVRKSPDKYRALFTTQKEGKTDIVVMGEKAEKLEIEAIIEQLKLLVPSDVDAFLPEFTTANPPSRLAMNAAFCDAVSPFYNYMMMLCGIPRVDVRGEKSDWDKINKSVAYIGNLMGAVDAKLTTYFKRVAEIVDALMAPTKEFLNDMIDFPRCGSGSDVEAAGWFTDLFVEKPRPAYPGNFSLHIARVDYKVLWENQDYILRCGIFSSALDGNGLLVPSFNHLVHRAAPATA